MFRFQVMGIRPERTRGPRFVSGIVLIAVSFLVYPAFIVILFLPFSAPMKVAAIVAASVLSWTSFSAGIWLAGRRGYHWLKALWKP